MTRLHLTRDSVAAGDDIHAPHTKVVDVPSNIVSPQQLVGCLVEIAPGYLAKVGGPATWAAFSKIPLVVLPNLEREPQPLWSIDVFEQHLDRDADEIRVHFAYFQSEHPEAVRRVLERLIGYLGR